MQGCANNNGAKFAPTTCSTKLSGTTDRFLKLKPSSDKCTAVCQAVSCETRSPQESDDSDPEIFRVKRRSTLGLQKRRAEEVISNISQQKVYFLYTVCISNYMCLRYYKISFFPFLLVYFLFLSIQNFWQIQKKRKSCHLVAFCLALYICT